MKLTILFFLLGIFQVSGKAYSQDIPLTLHFSQKKLSQALTFIEHRSNYRFLYNDAEVPVNQKVSLDVVNMPITTVLNQLLASTHLQYKILENHLIVISSSTVQQQPIPLKGHVTDSQGQPLIGVTIQIKGTTIGTQTDEEGNFSIQVPPQAVLIVSYVGFQTQEIAVDGQSSLAITLPISKAALSEIVVVGYGTQKKIDITGATASIKGSDLINTPVLTATQALQGKMAGVQIISSGQPGSSPVVRIRGTGTMLGGSNPLYVVDGVITDDISNINTADILNVDVLKDASSEAIYGVRGANGVIIITTKQGVPGKLRVTYNDNVGIRMASNLIQMANSSQYLDYEQAALGPAILPTKYSTNWYSQILRHSLEQNHDITLSGGTRQTRYLFSAGYYEDQGIVINNDYKRFTIRSNDAFNLTNQITLGVQASFSNGITQNVNLGTAYNDAYRAAPIIPGMIGDKYGNTSLFQNVGNPILDINNNNNKSTQNRFQGNTYLSYQPIPGLTFKTSLGGDLINDNNKTYNDQFASDTSTFITPGGNQSNSTSNLNLSYGKTFHWVWDNTVTFKRRFGKNDLTLLGGTTSEEYLLDYFSASRRNVPADPNLWYLGAGDQNSQANGGGGDKWARNSYICRVNYTYAGKYLFTGTVREDGSSRFPIQNRWGFFPAMGVGWI
ncbi:MAG: SusC/RagA family TonB-linked outer membrane protein, partial [Chitinophagaceae bacterium]